MHESVDVSMCACIIYVFMYIGISVFVKKHA